MPEPLDLNLDNLDPPDGETPPPPSPKPQSRRIAVHSFLEGEDTSIEAALKERERTEALEREKKAANDKKRAEIRRRMFQGEDYTPSPEDLLLLEEEAIDHVVSVLNMEDARYRDEKKAIETGAMIAPPSAKALRENEAPTSQVVKVQGGDATSEIRQIAHQHIEAAAASATSESLAPGPRSLRTAKEEFLKRVTREIYSLSPISQVQVVLQSLADRQYFAILFKYLPDVLKNRDLYIALARVGKIEVAEHFLDRFAAFNDNHDLPFGTTDIEHENAAFYRTVERKVVSAMRAVKPSNFAELSADDQAEIIRQQREIMGGTDTLYELPPAEQALILTELAELSNVGQVITEFDLSTRNGFNFFLSALMQGKAYLLRDEAMRTLIRTFGRNIPPDGVETLYREIDRGDDSVLLRAGQGEIESWLREHGLASLIEQYRKLVALPEGVKV